jgi:hypothetical protein
MDAGTITTQLPEVCRLMRQAAIVVTGGLEVRVDTELVQPGEHYKDARGREMWEMVAPVIGLELGPDGYP